MPARCEIREIAYGLHTPEDLPLAEFKTSLGFPAVHVPSRVKINPLVAPLVRRLNPHGTTASRVGCKRRRENSSAGIPRMPVS
jgi:hypothetical protein